jgi:flagellar biosynthesis protein FliR
MMAITTSYYPQAILLVVARVAGVLGILQYFGAAKIPAQIRAALIMVVALAMLPMVPGQWMQEARMLTSLPAMSVALLQEAAIGLCIGLVCQLIMASTSIAGALIGMGTSMMMARSIDPLSGQQTSIPQQLLMSVLVLFLLLTNVHLDLIHLLGKSFTTLPMLSFWRIDDITGLIVAVGSMMFDWGLRLAMPVFCVALLMDGCLGLMSKLAPDFDILFLSMPIRLYVGLSLLGLVLHAGSTVFGQMRDEMLLVFAKLLIG